MKERQDAAHVKPMLDPDESECQKRHGADQQQYPDWPPAAVVGYRVFYHRQEEHLQDVVDDRGRDRHRGDPGGQVEERQPGQQVQVQRVGNAGGHQKVRPPTWGHVSPKGRGRHPFHLVLVSDPQGNLQCDDGGKEHRRHGVILFYVQQKKSSSDTLFFNVEYTKNR